MAKLPTIKEMAEEVAKEAIERIYAEKPELKELSEAYQDGYEQGKADAIEEFAEWLPKHFDLRFSNNPQVWVDEYFNHTSEKIINELKEQNK